LSFKDLKFASYEFNKYEFIEIYDKVTENKKLITENVSLKNLTEDNFRKTLNLDISF